MPSSVLTGNLTPSSLNLVVPVPHPPYLLPAGRYRPRADVDQIRLQEPTDVPINEQNIRPIAVNVARPLALRGRVDVIAIPIDAAAAVGDGDQFRRRLHARGAH